MIRIICRLLRNKKGVSMIEYALLLGIVAIAAVTAINNIRGDVQKKFDTIDKQLG